MRFKKGLFLNPGVTATELIILIAVLAIIAAVAMPSFIGTLKKQRIDAAARHLVSDLRLAQSNAVSAGKRYRVLFNSSNVNQYKMQMEVSSNNWQDVTGWTDISSTYTGVSVQSAPPSPYDVKFNTRGALDGTATITITIRDSSGTTRNIVVMTTGKVSIS